MLTKLMMSDTENPTYASYIPVLTIMPVTPRRKKNVRKSKKNPSSRNLVLNMVWPLQLEMKRQT
eukprot:CAMPEP_0184661850 /NCGR_PEP_ID=MMETSP0308-20130426/40494_1 /TAXON_ID=38269 /ORGANISM="Gloeochaete witrockiana, Strain SAG 46.84" /LENGTH=63 /DNA_ID=CAMNT_0027103455 /DNA_START=1584 /DNA_END=1775 /DNA_ORIENTATION=-